MKRKDKGELSKYTGYKRLFKVNQGKVFQIVVSAKMLDSRIIVGWIFFELE